MKVFTFIGALPQFFKASVVSHAISHTEGLTDLVVNTDQHFDASMSGGVQRGAFFHSVSCVMVRVETEWVELVDAIWNRRSPSSDARTVVAAIAAGRGCNGPAGSFYGVGRTAGRILEVSSASRTTV